jgi:hypothetical protein
MGAVMKKLLLILLAMICAGLGWGSFQLAEAQETGGFFSMTPAGDLSLGLRADWVSQQKIKDTNLKATLSNQGVSFSETGRLTGLKLENDYYLSANGAYGITEWLNVFAQVGLVNGGTLKMDGAEAKLGSNLFWALGLKIRPFETDGGLGLMITARYMRYDDREVKDWKIGGTGPADKYGYSTDDNAKYWQVDAAALVYWKLGKVTPYLGGAYTMSELQYDGKWNNPSNGATVTYDAKFKPKDEYLVLAGLDFMLLPNMVLNLQGAFGGRTEVGLGLNYNF